jgi:hypothetical protein
MIHRKFASVALIALMTSAIGFSQAPADLRKEDPPIPAQEIIRKFAEKEKEFAKARENYVYRQDVRVQSLNANGRVTGEYRMVSDIGFDDKGRRTERIVQAPPDTLKGIIMTKEDLQDLREIQPFVLTSDDIAKYNIKYLGKEKIDEIDCYVFDVGPKVMEKGQRYFEGNVWVDDQDLQIVKSYGKAVPDIRQKNGEENLFPRFETYREQIDKTYWFPTYTRANDTLRFATGSQRMRMVVEYKNYKKFEADVKLTFGDAVDGEAVEKAPTTEPDTNKAPALDPRLKQPPKERKK